MDCHLLIYCHRVILLQKTQKAMWIIRDVRAGSYRELGWYNSIFPRTVGLCCSVWLVSDLQDTIWSSCSGTIVNLNYPCILRVCGVSKNVQEKFIMFDMKLCFMTLIFHGSSHRGVKDSWSIPECQLLPKRAVAGGISRKVRSKGSPAGVPANIIRHRNASGEVNRLFKIRAGTYFREL